MKILIVEDEEVARTLLKAQLERLGHQPVVATDGVEAWALMQGEDPPRMVILDWRMPRLDGLELCRLIKDELKHFTYVLLLTAQTSKEALVRALDAGADEFLSKPYDLGELASRVRVGERSAGRHAQLEARLGQLKVALDKASRLGGILPICMHCKRIREAAEGWTRLESFFEGRSRVRFSHGLCTDCFDDESERQVG